MVVSCPLDADRPARADSPANLREEPVAELLPLGVLVRRESERRRAVGENLRARTRGEFPAVKFRPQFAREAGLSPQTRSVPLGTRADARARVVGAELVRASPNLVIYE